MFITQCFQTNSGVSLACTGNNITDFTCHCSGSDQQIDFKTSKNESIQDIGSLSSVTGLTQEKKQELIGMRNCIDHTTDSWTCTLMNSELSETMCMCTNQKNEFLNYYDINSRNFWKNFPNQTIINELKKNLPTYATSELIVDNSYQPQQPLIIHIPNTNEQIPTTQSISSPPPTFAHTASAASSKNHHPSLESEISGKKLISNSPTTTPFQIIVDTKINDKKIEKNDSTTIKPLITTLQNNIATYRNEITSVIDPFTTPESGEIVSTIDTTSPFTSGSTPQFSTIQNIHSTLETTTKPEYSTSKGLIQEKTSILTTENNHIQKPVVNYTTGDQNINTMLSSDNILNYENLLFLGLVFVLFIAIILFLVFRKRLRAFKSYHTKLKKDEQQQIASRAKSLLKVEDEFDLYRMRRSLPRDLSATMTTELISTLEV